MRNPRPTAAGAKQHSRVVLPGLVALCFLFFCSGSLALIYEVIWQRQFALVFGSAAPATAAILAAYFVGLGAGSLALGAAAKRWTRPRRAYAVLEVMVAIGALLVVPLLRELESLHPWLFERFSTNPNLFFLVKTLLASVSIGLPTFCMGGTLPVLAQVVDRGQRRLGISAGLLYVANTSGAALGALSVPFLFLPAFGIQGTLWFCISGNLLLALGAWMIDRRVALEDLRVILAAPKLHDRSKKATRHRPVLIFSLISGLVTFVLQVLWNRAFAQVHENSIYSFAVIVAVFIFALAIGAHLARMGLRRGFTPERLIGSAWLFGGVLVAISPWLFLQFTGGLAYLPSDGGWSDYALRLIVLAVAVLFLPVALLGVGFPVLMEQAGRQSDANTASLLGQLLAANLIGSVAGALMAGFLFPHWLGLWNGILLTAALLIVSGVWQFTSATAGRRAWRFRFALLVAFGCSLWPISKLELPRVRISERLVEERLVALSEGTHGIVAVVERPHSRHLKLNNHYVLGGTASAGDERLQAHVPLLLHPSPRRVVLLGLGTGITASGALFHPVEQITAVELVPEIVAAARRYFREANGGVLEDTRTRVIVEDARNYLRGTTARFDVIIGDLVAPWRQGESALFTLEHFTAARGALSPGGLFCQWLPMFQLSEPELKILLRTFISVFPRAYVWRGDFSPNEPAVALIGSVEPFDLRPFEVEHRIREMKLDPLNPQLAEPAAFWMHFVGVLEPEDLNEVRINREDRPWIELLGPMQHAGQRTGSLCTGRRLQAWLNEVKKSSTGKIANLGSVETAGSQAGELLFEYTLLLSEKNDHGARAVQTQLRDVLSKPVFKNIFR